MRGMKAKTISAIITKKHKQLVESITNPKVQELVKENSICTGGAIASMLLGEEVKDFDFYFTNKETVVAVCEYYASEFARLNPGKHDIQIRQTDERVKIYVKSAGVVGENSNTDEYQYFEGVGAGDDHQTADYVSKALDQPEEQEKKDKPKYRPIFFTSNAITLSNKVQLVVRFYGEAEEIHKNYDFIHCTNYWTSKDRELVLRPEALQALLSRELRYVGSRYPICSILRARKFIERGWTCNAGQYLKMILQASSLTLMDIKVLEEQLVGVDHAYFVQMLDMIKQREDTQRLDYTYLVQIIDRVF